MRPCHDLPHALGYAAHYHTLFSRRGYDVNGVSTVVGCTEHRLGQGDGLVGTAAKVHTVGCPVVYSHHGIVGGVYPHRLAARVASTGKEVLVYLLAYDAHLALPLHVHLVDVPAIVELGNGHLGIVGVYALGAAAEGLVAIHHGFSPAKEEGSDDIQFGYVLAESFYVTDFHVP